MRARALPQGESGSVWLPLAIKKIGNGDRGDLSPFGLNEIAVGLVDEDQHAEHRHVETEGGVLPVPVFRLPHGEPFAGDHHEAEIPDEKGEQERADGEGLGLVERGRGRVARLIQANGAARNKRPVMPSAMISA